MHFESSRTTKSSPRRSTDRARPKEMPLVKLVGFFFFPQHGFQLQRFTHQFNTPVYSISIISLEQNKPTRKSLQVTAGARWSSSVRRCRQLVEILDGLGHSLWADVVHGVSRCLETGERGGRRKGDECETVSLMYTITKVLHL